MADNTIVTIIWGCVVALAVVVGGFVCVVHLLVKGRLMKRRKDVPHG